jgi:hypothetical protein
MHGANTFVSEGLIPEGRKKLSSAGGTNAPAGPTLQVAIVNGLVNSGCALVPPRRSPAPSSPQSLWN